jgi:hypothetical protein
LTVVGVTGEAKANTDKWVKDKGAKYAYAYDRSKKFFRLAGVSGIPHALLIDATGRVLYSGGAGGYSEDLLKQAMTGAAKKPLWELPKEFAKARTAIVKGDFAAALKECDALAAAEKVAADAEALKAVVKSMIEGRLSGAKAASDAGDWAFAKETYEKLAKGCSGLPEEKAAKEALAKIAADPEAQKGLKAQKALESVLAMPDKKAKDREAKVAALRAFAKKNDGTFAGKKAEQAIDALPKN